MIHQMWVSMEMQIQMVLRVHDDDEFVELVNGSSSPIDLSGYMFFDAEAIGILHQLI